MARRSNFRSQAHRPDDEQFEWRGALLMLVMLGVIVMAASLGMPPQ